MVQRFTSILVYLEAPLGLSYLWNFGVTLGSVWGFQVCLGIFLMFYYEVGDAFFFVEEIKRGAINGDVFRRFHVLFGRIFFFLLYCHIIRGV
jgi:quinol-cytochrome oxidoreductase complex cytochrome b subunit